MRNADGLQYSSFGKIKENTQKQVASRYARLKAMGETLQNSVMCFDEPFDGVYLAFSDSSSVGRTTTAIAVIEGVTGSSPVYPITTN